MNDDTCSTHYAAGARSMDRYRLINIYKIIEVSFCALYSYVSSTIEFGKLSMGVLFNSELILKQQH